ncbi:MAG: hypothetical protein LBS99_04640, partial [Clostridiales bacterium]|nr:hypothetical protein [Clostridiales bacterium]
MRKVKTGIIIIIALFALAFTVAACSSGSSRQTLRDKGMVCAILDCAGGSIDGEPKKELYQIPPAYLPRPGSLIEIPEPMRANYTLIGWFLGERNADGDIVYGAEWDFSVDKMTEDITLYAMWRESFYFDFYYADAPDTLVETKRGISLTAAAATPERTGHTYTGDSYFDAAKQLPVAYPFTPAEGSGLHIAIFTEWVEGDYIIVRAPADLNGANVSANYYLMNDLDFAAAANWTVRDSYTGILDGNGYTIRNLTAANANLLFDSYGLFGKLVGATVRNLTFASCRLSAVVNTSRGQMRFGVLAGAADANARVK